MELTSILGKVFLVGLFLGIYFLLGDFVTDSIYPNIYIPNEHTEKIIKIIYNIFWPVLGIVYVICKVIGLMLRIQENFKEQLKRKDFFKYLKLIIKGTFTID